MNSRGSLFPIWQRQIDNGDPLTITDERMERYMMTMEEAVGLVIQATEEGEGGQIWVMDMGKKVNIKQLAMDILRKSGSCVGIKTIGIRPGETLSERLMFAEEEKVSEKRGNFFVIK